MAAPEEASKTVIDYGLDAPETVSNFFWRAGSFAALGIGIWYMNRQDLPGPGVTLMVIFVLIGLAFLGVALYMRWSSQIGKLQLREEILGKVQWTGDEKVLDAGCGRGLLAIGAARRLKKGRVTGIDIWDPQSLSGNKQELAIANAKAEGVADRVKIENGDIRQLTYGDNSFDVVLSSTVLHEIPDAPDRAAAIRELLRVTRPGGQLVLFDILHAGEYGKVLSDAGADQIDDSTKKWLWLVPGRIVTARKKPAA
jgi:SAM-dependent methyltransferase